MRSSFWLLLLAVVCVPIHGSPRIMNAAPTSEKKILPNDTILIADTLAERFDIEARLERVKLKEVLHMLEERLGTTIILDLRALRSDGDENDPNALTDWENKEITIPTMKKVRGQTVLKYVCDRIGAVAIIESDHIRITTQNNKDLIIGGAFPIPSLNNQVAQDAELSILNDERVRQQPLINAKFENATLNDIVKTIRERSGHSILIAQSAQELAENKLSFSLINVPVESAVASIAEAAGLSAIKNGNVIIMTTTDRFNEIIKSQNPTNGFNPWPIGAAFTQKETSKQELRNDLNSLRTEVEKLNKERMTTETTQQELLKKFEQLKEELGKKK